MMAGAGQVRVVRGEHAGPEFDAWIALCRAAVGPSTVHHLAQYSYGTFDFGLDVLDERDGTGRKAAQRRDEVSYLGRQLHFMMRTIGDSLEKCDSGRLIRAVFEAGSGALMFFEIRPGQYLVGLTVDVESVPAADRAMAVAATGIRASLGLPDQSPGGFHPAPGEPGGLPRPDPGSLATSKGSSWTSLDDLFLDLAAEQVISRTMDYAARFEKFAWTSSTDTFNDGTLAQHFTNITRRRRREVYEEIGAHYQTLSSAVDRGLYGVIEDRVTRAVLDVEQGALYFQRRGENELLMGVTLAQARVQSAEQHFKGLVRRFVEVATP